MNLHVLKISRVGKMLADEYGPASNIKSRVNRYFVVTQSMPSKAVALPLNTCVFNGECVVGVVADHHRPKIQCIWHHGADGSGLAVAGAKDVTTDRLTCLYSALLRT